MKQYACTYIFFYNRDYYTLLTPIDFDYINLNRNLRPNSLTHDHHTT
jgi:hypothetical protein